MNKTISVIVPVYKVEKYLDRCVQSIVDQTYENLEIILVDDGSPDKCPQICDAWAMRDARIRVIHQENGGLTAVRNTGLDAATGDLICFVDSDDAVVPTMCEKVIKTFWENDVEIVAFNCQKITETGVFLGGTETLTTGVLSQEEALSELIGGNINDYLWSKVYKRSLFDHIRITTDRACFEDTDITYRLIMEAEHIYCMDEQLYFYYQHSDSVTASMTAAKLCDLYQVRLERYRVLRERYPYIAEQAILRLARAALFLYDRSLWEVADESIVKDARSFLKENRTKVLSVDQSINIRVYYFVPDVYRCVRRAKHIAGNLIKYLKRKMK